MSGFQLQPLLDAMPPVAAMQVRAQALADGRLRLSAPLAANVNDKDCAFGGSLSGLMTLAGWGALMQALHAEGLAVEVFVADAQTRFLAPLYADLQAEAELPAAEQWATLLERLRTRGRGSCRLHARILGPDGLIAEQQARYAVFVTADADQETPP
jgi:thioesterase domain-containing protein